MDKLTLKRGGQVLAPSLFTIGNMGCGFYSLIASTHDDFTASATAILGGIAFDILDGRVARMVHGESSFGVELDSLSDFLTFGVAPAYMMHQFILKDYGLLGGICAFLFALCGGLRLARFNVAAQANDSPKPYFQGLPIPAGAGLLASCVVLYGILEEQRSAHTMALLMGRVSALVAVAPLIVTALALLMVSTIPYATFKQKSPAQDFRLLAIVAAALLLVYFYPQNALFLFFLVYVLSGIFGLVGRHGGAK